MLKVPKPVECAWLFTLPLTCILCKVPALTFNDAPLGLPAQDTPPIHQVLSVSPDHSKGDPVLQEMKQKGWPCLGGGERSHCGKGTLSSVERKKVVEGAQRSKGKRHGASGWLGGAWDS